MILADSGVVFNMEYVVIKYYNQVGKVAFRFGELTYLTQRFKDEGKKFEILRRTLWSPEFSHSDYESFIDLRTDFETYAERCYTNYVE